MQLQLREDGRRLKGKSGLRTKYIQALSTLLSIVLTRVKVFFQKLDKKSGANVYVIIQSPHSAGDAPLHITCQNNF